MRYAWVLACVLLAPGAAAQSPGAAARSRDTVVIDGAKNPELIPEYVMWQMALTTLYTLADGGVTHVGPFAPTEPLSESDRQLLIDEATREHQREQGCAAKARRQVEVLAGQSYPQMQEALQPLNVQCRQATLDAVERLLAKMTPEGRDAFVNWVLGTRASIKSQMSKLDWEKYYRYPR